MSFVLDSSVSASWCFKDEETPETLRLLTMAKTRVMFVPSLWYLETSNILGLALKKGRLREVDLQRSVDMLNTLEIKVEDVVRTNCFSTVIPLMRKHDLTAYDAAYLELALRLEIPLATFDIKLQSAARYAGVVLVSPSEAGT